VTALRPFFDANELIRLALSYHGDMAPTVLSSDRLEVSGDPIAVLAVIAESGELVNGQTLSVNTSARTLQLARAKLAEVYRWEDATVTEFTRLVLGIVRASGGSVHRDSISLVVYGALMDPEDRHRLAEAIACGAEVFITEDQEIDT
jgi:hypothetical protein